MKMSSREFTGYLEAVLECNVGSFCRRKKMECVTDALNSFGRHRTTKTWAAAIRKPVLSCAEFKRAVSDLMAASVDRMDAGRKKEAAKKILFGTRV
ncbi:hypothetical protein [Pelagibaculum spongiae]|uniref:Uncharacterized protein n=1 Tax=Pelagibaculum spongiae TaxID=2080658 RepID=A0A2V1GYW8_9GAMM|nr:hypothetical protein [Pelagibaculum spongiae]PVZ70557.1 hypothetical protein DC094_08220 [Pelagibaculum spongiae]